MLLGSMIASRHLSLQAVEGIVRVVFVDELDTEGTDWLRNRHKFSFVNKIDLSYGGIRPGFQYEAFNRVSKLDVSYNRLRVLPKGICSLSSLTRLYANDNCLSSLPATVRFLIHLKELDLRNNRLKEVSKYIRDLGCLQRLSVEGNPLTVDEIKKLTELLDKKSSFFVDITGKN